MSASEGDLFFASSHQHPCYPGTGSPSEIGVAGNILNMHLSPGAGGVEFRLKWEREGLPIGNGAMGAVIAGGVQRDLIQFNEKTLWTGGPGAAGRAGHHERSRRTARRALSYPRRASGRGAAW